jgi:hypothetical protein
MQEIELIRFITQEEEKCKVFEFKTLDEAETFKDANFVNTLRRRNFIVLVLGLKAAVFKPGMKWAVTYVEKYRELLEKVETQIRWSFGNSYYAKIIDTFNDEINLFPEDINALIKKYSNNCRLSYKHGRIFYEGDARTFLCCDSTILDSGTQIPKDSITEVPPKD